MKKFMFLFFEVTFLMSQIPKEAEAKWDIQNICTEVAKDSVGNLARNLNRNDLNTLTSEEIYQRLKQAGSQSGMRVWIGLMHSRIEVIEATWRLQNDLAEDVLHHYGYPDTHVEVLLSEVAKKAPTYSAEGIAETKKILQKVKMDTTFDHDIETIKKGAFSLCLGYPQAWGCKKAVRDLADFMHPHAYSANLSALPLMEHVMLDPAFARGAAHLALKINQRIKDEHRFESVEGNLFQDATSSFKEMGFQEREAVDRAWDLLGFLATRGASQGLLIPIYHHETAALHLASYWITAGMTYLDHMRMSHESQKLYSYTEKVSTNCVYGKPYHFWMAAYFTRWAIKTGVDPYSATIASHLLGLLYEFATNTTGRDATTVYYADYLSNHTNGLRVNMLYNDLGARFATTLVRNLKFDRGFKRMFNRSRPLPPMSKAQIQEKIKNPVTRLLYFKKIVAPDAALMVF